LSLRIRFTRYRKSFVGLPVNELHVFILEHLPPSRVSAPDLHIIGLT
jgi:hypothetical protein